MEGWRRETEARIMNTLSNSRLSLPDSMMGTEFAGKKQPRKALGTRKLRSGPSPVQFACASDQEESRQCGAWIVRLLNPYLRLGYLAVSRKHLQACAGR